MVDGLVRKAVRGMPGGGSGMQFSQVFVLLPQAVMEQVCEEVVIAVPSTVGIQWNDEEVGLLELF